MSFRQRLTGFFIAIVILPMAIVGFVLFRLIEDNEIGKADASLAAQQEVEVNLFREARDRARTAASQIAADQRLATALQDDDRAAAQARATRLLETRRARRIVVIRQGRTFIDVGSRTATAPAAARLLGSDGRPAGTLQVSVTEGAQYANDAASLVDGEVVVSAGGQLLGSSVARVRAADDVPSEGDVTIGADGFRAASFQAPGFLGARTRVVTLAATGATDSDVERSRMLAAGLLALFFVLAFIFALVVSRSLQQQIGGVLSAARRLGAGDLDARVPAVGNDEFAELGREFNKMAEQLQARLDELQRERERVQSSMRRLGQAVGSNLDAEALLQLVVETAVEGVDATTGRVVVRERDGELEEAARVGDVALSDAVRQAEERALQTGRPQTVAAPGSVALAHPLRVHESDGAAPDVAGVVSVGRAGRPFSLAETELFHYLAAQAAVSVENVGRHEAVARQSVTDPLTRLANRRRFDEALTAEVERATRLGQPLGLVLLDLDDFKAVNDEHGHQQGDIVLREVARAVRRACRDIDIAARYGGEELAVILPSADLDGAFELAERVRRGVAALAVPRLAGDGELRVTASLGVAALPATATDGAALVAGADAALYRAKREGKNRAIRADLAGVVPAE